MPERCRVHETRDLTVPGQRSSLPRTVEEMVYGHQPHAIYHSAYKHCSNLHWPFSKQYKLVHNCCLYSAHLLRIDLFINLCSPCLTDLSKRFPLYFMFKVCVCQVKGECNVWDLALLSLQLDTTCQHMIFQSASDVSSWFSNTHVRQLLSIIWGSCKVLVQSLLCNRIAGFDSLFHAGDANTDAMRIGFPLSGGFLFPAALKTDRLWERTLVFRMNVLEDNTFPWVV